ncbi:unnamed protein product [Arabis nemorensis]|uniref:Uncharacterized protein n=1 Tax=Arabis nemorensis TaxID=586526 RepID=A0A565AV34_9BRAS|nr:unnamed protein product [Arabis nemorensis]
MEIASTSRTLHLFPTEQRFKIKRLGCKLIDFSDDVSSLPINPNKSAILSRTCRNLKEEEEEAPNMRQKRTVEQNSTTKVYSVFQNPNETPSMSKITKPVDAKSVALSRIRLHHETRTKPIDEETEKQGSSLRDLIAKAKNKVQEKRKLDDRREYIARKRLEARLAINQVVPTVVADDHLKYHYELEQLGCTFIHDQVTCLTKFRFLSRSDLYIDESSTSSVLEEETQLLRSYGDSSRQKQQRSTESSLEERKHSNCQSSTIERIQ